MRARVAKLGQSYIGKYDDTVGEAECVCFKEETNHCGAAAQKRVGARLERSLDAG